MSEVFYTLTVGIQYNRLSPNREEHYQAWPYNNPLNSRELRCRNYIFHKQDRLHIPRLYRSLLPQIYKGSQKYNNPQHLLVSHCYKEAPLLLNSSDVDMII